MSVRVVARIRPLLKAEIEKDVIVDRAGDVVRIPNPKKESELYSFQFSSVYDQTATQSEVFDAEVAPTVKHLFKGFDVTLFAYGVTGTGKTHTMRGGKSLADRGVIPRLLSSIYRRARKVEKDSAASGNQTQVDVAMSYYEIYNDRVYDLFEGPEKRTPAGLPIRDNQSGKAIVVGLTERPCTSLKEFEQLYDQANLNRSTSATKLNAHSSRSHAVLCVRVTQTTDNAVRISTASAIDLAGSEDNRRTDNNKERLVESASINKSLFVLASCVEAVSKKATRIPYRESKMTRILALGQNNGLTVMILNLAPVRSYHLDTLSSLNFANRTKKIEVNEIENQPFFRDPAGKGKLESISAAVSNGPALNRQPLRPKILSHDSHLKEISVNAKPAKQFAVYTDKSRSAKGLTSAPKSPKRTSSEALPSLGRLSKVAKAGFGAVQAGMSTDAIEALIERKVNEALAGRGDQTTVSQDPVPNEVQQRLDALERRVDGQETERAEGLQYLLMAKQHQVRGEDMSALKMYELALPHFPGNEKLMRKVVKLQDKISASKSGRDLQAQEAPRSRQATASVTPAPGPVEKSTARRKAQGEDDSYHEAQDDAYDEEDDGFIYRPRTKIRRPHTANLSRSTAVRNASPPPGVKHSPPAEEDSEDELVIELSSQTPRTKQLLSIINTKDVSQIKLLRGVGAKKAEAIVNCLCDIDDDVTSLGQLGKMKGVGVKTVENMRNGL